MFVLDDIALSPFRGLLWIAKEIQAAALRAEAAEADDIRQRLSELYMQLETGRIDEATFDRLEAELLDRLDVIEAARAAAPDEADDTEEPEDDADDP